MSTPVWTPVGPLCLLNASLSEDEKTGKSACSGRVTAIAIDPTDPDNTIYAGTASGGVWKTSDGGLNWVPKTDTEECLGVGAIAISNGTVVVGTGEPNTSGSSAVPGLGFLFSVNGGDTWQKRPADNSFRGQGIYRILADPLNKDHWIAATTIGLFESTNGGADWTETIIPGNFGPDVSDAVLDASNPASQNLYVALSGYGIYRRLGAGNFEQFAGLPTAASDSVRRTALAISKSQPATMYAAFARDDGSVQGIWATDNATAALADVKWEKRGNIPVRAEQSSYNLTIAVAPDKPQSVFFGEERLWRSVDGGRKWELLSNASSTRPGIHADQHAIAFHPTNPSTIWIGNDGGVWLSTDGGATFAHRNRGLQALQFFSVAQHAFYESVLLGGTQDNGAARFEGTPAWIQSDGGDGIDTAIDPKDARNWYHTYFWDTQDASNFRPVFGSESAGEPDSWKDLKKGLVAADLPDDVARIKFVMDMANPTTLYLGTTNLYQSNDQGQHWDRMQTGSGSTRAVFSTGNKSGNRITAIGLAPNTIYVGTVDGQFWVLTQSGGVWSKVDRSTGLGGDFIGDIAVHPTDPNKVYVGLGGPHYSATATSSPPGGRLFRSDDGGKNWIPLTPNFPPMVNPVGTALVDRLRNPVNTIAIDPADPKVILAGCDVGVFRSPDEGASWVWWNQNLPNVVVSQLVIHPKARLIRAATLGRGVWERQLDAPTAPDADIYIRDNVLDVGRRPTQKGPDPFTPTQIDDWPDGIDLKVDTTSFFGNFTTPSSTVDYKSGSAIDAIGFHDMPHSNPRHGANAKVYLQVHNRGPKPAKNVKVRVFYANKTSGGFPDLPADFWTKFPDADPSDTSVWHPIGASQVPELRPAEPAVFTFPWSPSDISDPVGILAAVTSPDDPINEGGLSIASIVPSNKRILLKEMPVKSSDLVVVLEVIAVLGLLAIGGYELYTHRHEL